MRVKIQVTEDDIKKGGFQAFNCPINLAASRRFTELGLPSDVWVGHAYLRAGITRYRLPMRAQKFITRRENESEHQPPFAFYLNVLAQPQVTTNSNQEGE